MQGTLEKVDDQTSMLDRILGRKLHGVKWHYTVDGQASVAVRYAPQDPQISAIRGLMRADGKLLIE